jgi:hypothetical protein
VPSPCANGAHNFDWSAVCAACGDSNAYMHMLMELENCMWAIGMFIHCVMQPWSLGCMSLLTYTHIHVHIYIYEKMKIWFAFRFCTFWVVTWVFLGRVPLGCHKPRICGAVRVNLSLTASCVTSQNSECNITMVIRITLNTPNVYHNSYYHVKHVFLQLLLLPWSPPMCLGVSRLPIYGPRLILGGGDPPSHVRTLSAHRPKNTPPPAKAWIFINTNHKTIQASKPLCQTHSPRVQWLYL